MPAPIAPLRLVPLRAMSDERLAVNVARGDRDAFAQLYERYREPLARYCRSIVRDAEDAGDALQATMLSALRAMQVKAPNGRIRPWLYKIAHNESINVLRRRRPEEQLTDDLSDRVSDPASDLGDSGAIRERLVGLLSDLRRLPERQRGALVMRELAGLEYAEIGSALRMSGIAARKAVHEARVSLTAMEAGRDAGCDDIMRQISAGDGRSARGRRVRGHLQGCAACTAFEQGLRQRRRSFALLPVFPALSLSALLGHGALPFVAGAGAGSAAAAATGASAGMAGGAGRAVAGGATALGGGGATMLGGGGVAAIKCAALCGALAVAGAGVFVGGNVTSRGHSRAHARHAGPHARPQPAVHVSSAAVPAAVHPASTSKRPAHVRASATHRAMPALHTATRPAHQRVSAVPPAATHPAVAAPANPATSAPAQTQTATPAPAAQPRTNPLATLTAQITAAEAAAIRSATTSTQTGTQALQSWQQALAAAQQQASTSMTSAYQTHQSLLNQVQQQAGGSVSSLQQLISSLSGGTFSK